ncbi:hypothetical protein M9Y10_001662 [Tritrichomonas musculus]|uniref:Protein kinase domain-containing protein n=1 Tax=Tritrichomonas musculus TaxID=1915356 RepID=A0ABR2L7P2_9EUKA
MDDDVILDLNSFTLMNRIGLGGFSEVFKVKDNKTGNVLAAKISLKPFIDNNDSEIRNLKREINILAKLNHPSILKFFGFSPFNFHKDEKPTIITEFMPNGSLADIIELERKSNSSSFWNETRKLINIYGIASAMAYLHLHKIIHRDLKPANILMDDYLCPKIADFGLSKVDHTNQESMSIQSSIGTKGTPIYIAPEIWEKSEYSPASDVYAFGLIVYEIITNDEPFKDCKFFEIPMKTLMGVRPEFKCPIAEPYQKLIQACWSQNPIDRPSFDDIVKDLKEDQGFVTDLVDEADYLDYVDYIEEYKTTFDSSRSPIPIDQFVKRKSSTFTKINIKDISKDSKDESSNTNNQTKSNSNKSYTYDELYNLITNKKVKQGGNEYRYMMKGVFKDDPESLYLFGIYNLCDDKIEEAAKYIKKSADKGYIEAIYQYGHFLSKGQGVTQDEQEAVKYFKKAADLGNSNSMYKYASCCIKGIGVKVNYADAKKYYQMAIDKDKHVGSLCDISMMIIKDFVPGDKKKAARNLKYAADHGNNVAMDEYAILLEKGEFVTKDLSESARYYKMSADSGFADGMFHYGYALCNGIGVAKNYTQAFKYYRMAIKKNNHNVALCNSSLMIIKDLVPGDKQKAISDLKYSADSGCSFAMDEYAKLLEEGKLIPKNLIESAKYYKKSADSGYADGMFHYGWALCNGDGVPKNYTEAFKYYQMAIKKCNHNLALCNSSLMIIKDAVPGDKKQAVRNLKISADNGNECAMNEYGELLDKGELVPKNLKEAAKYFKMSAEKGFEDGMFNYAWALTNGLGVTANYKEALRYYKICIDKFDNTGALCNYGCMLLGGVGVDKNKENQQNGLACIKKAADRGNTYASYFYGKTLLEGNYIRKNKKLAAEYLQKAADKGNDDAKALLKSL